MLADTGGRDAHADQYHFIRCMARELEIVGKPNRNVTYVVSTCTAWCCAQHDESVVGAGSHSVAHAARFNVPRSMRDQCPKMPGGV